MRFQSAIKYMIYNELQGPSRSRTRLAFLYPRLAKGESGRFGDKEDSFLPPCLLTMES